MSYSNIENPFVWRFCLLTRIAVRGVAVPWHAAPSRTISLRSCSLNNRWTWMHRSECYLFRLSGLRKKNTRRSEACLCVRSALCCPTKNNQSDAILIWPCASIYLCFYNRFSHVDQPFSSAAFSLSASLTGSGPRLRLSVQLPKPTLFNSIYLVLYRVFTDHSKGWNKMWCCRVMSPSRIEFLK